MEEFNDLIVLDYQAYADHAEGFEPLPAIVLYDLLTKSDDGDWAVDPDAAWPGE